MHPTSGSVHLSSTIINTSVRLPQTKNPLTIIHRFRHLSNRNSEKCRSNSVLPFPAPKNYGKRQAEFILQSKLLSISPHYHIHNRLIVPAGLIFPVLADQPFYSSCILNPIAQTPKPQVLFFRYLRRNDELHDEIIASDMEYPLFAFYKMVIALLQQIFLQLPTVSSLADVHFQI